MKRYRYEELPRSARLFVYGIFEDSEHRQLRDCVDEDFREIVCRIKDYAASHGGMVSFPFFYRACEATGREFGPALRGSVLKELIFFDSLPVSKLVEILAGATFCVIDREWKRQVRSGEIHRLIMDRLTEHNCLFDETGNHIYEEC